MLHSLFDSYAWLLDHWWYFHVFAASGVLVWVLFGTGSWRRAAKFFVYASLFSVTIVMVSTFFPFIGGKDYFFRTSIGLALIFYFLWGAFEAKRGELFGEVKEAFSKPLFLAVSAFVLAFLFASIFALDPSAAFWSNFERGEGGFQMLHYWAFFAMLAVLFRKEEDWRKLFKVACAAAFLMVLYGIIAQFGWGQSFISEYSSRPDGPPAGFWAKLTSARFQGSLGNPAYVAPYLFFAMFYAAYLLLRSETRWRAAGLAALILFFAFFFLVSQTRATFVGLGAAAIAFLLYSILTIKPWRKILAPMFLVLVALGGAGLYYQDSQFVKSLPGGRMFEISFGEQAFNTRLWTWGSAWRGFLERPIFGWGPENFSAVFDRHFDPRHYVPGMNTETWFDRAHSAYFDYLAETGVVGLAAYLGIFITFFWFFFKKPKQENVHLIHEKERKRAGALFHGDIAEKLTRGFMLALILGYMVQNIAIFEVLPMYINTFFFLGFAYYYFYHREITNAKS